MIIQHPDGRADVCALPPPLARWARDLLRRAQSLRDGGRAQPCPEEGDQDCPACTGGGTC